MKNKRLLTLFGSICLVLVLAVSPFMAACAAPVEPGVVDVAKLQREVTSLEKEVASGEKEIASLKGKITTAEAKASTSEKEAAASKKEIAAAEKEMAALEKEKTAAEKEIASLEAAVPEPAKVYEWRLQSMRYVGTSDWDIHLPRMRDWVTDMSDGRLDLTLYLPETLVGTFELFDAVAVGTVDMAHTTPIYWGGMLPSGLGAMYWCTPFSLERGEEFQYLCWETRWGEIIREEYAKLGVTLLGYGPWPGTGGSYGCLNSTRPIYTLDDFAGLKMRSFGFFAKMFAELGCEITEMLIGEAYTGLAMGTIEALSFGSPRDHYMAGFHEVAPYWISPDPPFISCQDMYVNPDAFNALPDDLQAILTLAARAFTFDTPPTWAYEDGIYLEKMVEEGATVINLSTADRVIMKEIMWRFIEEDAAADPVATEALNVMKEYMRLWGYLD